MKNLKLSLKKEIISNLEAKEVKGGADRTQTGVCCFQDQTIKDSTCESVNIACSSKNLQLCYL